MNLFEELTDQNFVQFAARNYYSPRCIDAEEFFHDLSRFKYIKRLVNRYNRGGDLGERLLLNHITIILNAFGRPAGVHMLEYKIGLENWSIIKPFLLMTDAIKKDQYTDVELDEDVVMSLRQI